MKVGAEAAPGVITCCCMNRVEFTASEGPSLRLPLSPLPPSASAVLRCCRLTCLRLPFTIFPQRRGLLRCQRQAGTPPTPPGEPPDFPEGSLLLGSWAEEGPSGHPGGAHAPLAASSAAVAGTVPARDRRAVAPVTRLLPEVGRAGGTGGAYGGRAAGQASSLAPQPRLAQESPPQPPPFCSQRSHSHNHLLLILSATSIKLFVETN